MMLRSVGRMPATGITSECIAAGPQGDGEMRTRDMDDDDETVRDGQSVRCPLFLMDEVQRTVAMDGLRLHDGMGVSVTSPAMCSATTSSTVAMHTTRVAVRLATPAPSTS